MRTWTTFIAAGLLLVLSSTAALALDCERVKALQAQGKRPSDIARELGLTTPDVQACLAGVVVEKPASPSQAGRIGLGSRLPGDVDMPVPRGPNQE